MILAIFLRVLVRARRLWQVWEARYSYHGCVPDRLWIAPDPSPFSVLGNLFL